MMGVNRENKRWSKLLSIFSTFLGVFCLLGVGMLLAQGTPMQLVSASLTQRSTQAVSQKVALSGGYHLVAYPGEIITFTHVVTNEGLLPDTIELEATSAHHWPVLLSRAEITGTAPTSGTLWLPLRLGAGEAMPFHVQVHVPTVLLSGTLNIIVGTTDTIVITATSSVSPTVFDTIADTLSVDAGQVHSIFLPFVTRHRPPTVQFGADFASVHPTSETLEYDLPVAQTMGMGWVRIYLPWEDIEPFRGEYHWEASDAVVTRMVALGIRPLALVYGPPAWAAAENCGPISDTIAFQGFMDNLLTRYGRYIDAWEFFNEPDGMYSHPWGATAGCWGSQPEMYAEQLQIFYKQIKTAGSSDLVVFGGLAYDNWVGGNVARDFFTQTLQHGAGQYFDVANLHYYPINFVDFPTMAHKIEEIREIMERNGVYDKRIWVTETGMWVNDIGVPGFAGSVEKQRNFIAKEFSRGFAAGADNIFWFDVVEHPAAADRVHRWLISMDHQPTNGYTTHQVFAEQLTGLYPQGAYLEVPEGIEAYEFMGNTHTLYVLWSNAVTQTVSLPATQSAVLISRDGDVVMELSIISGAAVFDVGMIPVLVKIQ
ncbi:MAG: hypothetical protein JXA33_28415 [Anaerolineae bacterium]|nr:hypothetical protein [Anaerolineae bacterium]